MLSTGSIIAIACVVLTMVLSFWKEYWKDHSWFKKAFLVLQIVVTAGAVIGICLTQKSADESRDKLTNAKDTGETNLATTEMVRTNLENFQHAYQEDPRLNEISTLGTTLQYLKLQLQQKSEGDAERDRILKQIADTQNLLAEKSGLPNVSTVNVYTNVTIVEYTQLLAAGAADPQNTANGSMMAGTNTVIQLQSPRITKQWVASEPGALKDAGNKLQNCEDTVTKLTNDVATAQQEIVSLQKRLADATKLASAAQPTPPVINPSPPAKTAPAVPAPPTNLRIR